VEDEVNAGAGGTETDNVVEGRATEGTLTEELDTGTDGTETGGIMAAGKVVEGRLTEGTLAEELVGASFTPGSSTSTVPGSPGVPPGMRVVIAWVMASTVRVVVTSGGS